VHFRAKSVEFLETHDQRPPFVGIDAVPLACRQDRLLDMHALNANLDNVGAAFQFGIIFGQVMHRLHHCLELHLAFLHARRPNRLRLHWSQSGDAEFIPLEAIAALNFSGGHRVRAGSARQPIDRGNEIDRGQIEHALAGALHVFRRLRLRRQAQHAAPAEPERR